MNYWTWLYKIIQGWIIKFKTDNKEDAIVIVFAFVIPASLGLLSGVLSMMFWFPIETAFFGIPLGLGVFLGFFALNVGYLIYRDEYPKGEKHG